MSGHQALWAYEHVLMSSYEQVLICSSRKIVRDMPIRIMYKVHS